MNGKKLRCVWHSKELFLGITGFNYVVSKQSGSFLNIDTVPKNLTAGKFACIFDKLSELTDSANCAHDLFSYWFVYLYFGIRKASRFSFA